MPRPKLVPSDEQRRLVKSLAAVGVPHQENARQIGICSPKTLRKHFREELDRGPRKPITPWLRRFIGRPLREIRKRPCFGSSAARAGRTVLLFNHCLSQDQLLSLRKNKEVSLNDNPA